MKGIWKALTTLQQLLNLLKTLRRNSFHTPTWSESESSTKYKSKYLCENGDDRGGRGGAGHEEPVVLRVVLRAETHGRRRWKQNKVSAEREEYQPDPQRKQYLEQLLQ